MRVILIPVSDRPECRHALQTGFTLANTVGAHVIGCHISAHHVNNESGTEDEHWDKDQLWNMVASTRAGKISKESAQALFEEMAATHKYPLIKHPKTEPGAVWMEKTGSPEKVLSIQGPVSDLVIVSRPKPGAKVAQMFLQAALFSSARPALILPQFSLHSIGKHVCIAWNQSAEAARAVYAAMPLLKVAASVHIVTTGSETTLGPKASQLASYLKFWGVKAELVKAIGKNDLEAVEVACREAECDLLVMGAYSRSRLRQRLFGGMTEYMLTKAEIPVFMLHD